MGLRAEDSLGSAVERYSPMPLLPACQQLADCPGEPDEAGTSHRRQLMHGPQLSFPKAHWH